MPPAWTLPSRPLRLMYSISVTDSEDGAPTMPILPSRCCRLSILPVAMFALARPASSKRTSTTATISICPAATSAAAGIRRDLWSTCPMGVTNPALPLQLTDATMSSPGCLARTSLCPCHAMASLTTVSGVLWSHNAPCCGTAMSVISTSPIMSSRADPASAGRSCCGAAVVCPCCPLCCLRWPAGAW